MLRTLLLLFRVSVPIIVLISGSFQAFLTALFSCPLLSTTVPMVLNLCTLLQYHLFKLFLPPSIFPSIRVFSNESALHIRWTKYWNFSFNISPSNEHPGLFSFRMDWLDLLAVQGTLKNLLLTPQFKSISSSALSFLYSPTFTSIHDHWKNHSLD